MRSVGVLEGATEVSGERFMLAVLLAIADVTFQLIQTVSQKIDYCKMK